MADPLQDRGSAHLGRRNFGLRAARPPSSSETDWEPAVAIDAENRARLRRIVAEVAWPGESTIRTPERPSEPRLDHRTSRMPAPYAATSRMERRPHDPAGRDELVPAALLVLALLGHPRRAPAPVRPALRWLLTRGLLTETSAVLGLIAQGHDWARIRRAVGAEELLLCLTGLACIATATISWRRRSPITPEQTSAPPSA